MLLIAPFTRSAARAMLHIVRGSRMWMVVVVVLACSSNIAQPDHGSAPTPVSSAAAGDDTMMFVHIEGTLDELRGLTTLKGLELQRGAHDLGGGRWRASGVVRVKSLIDDIKARGLTVTVTMDEDEVDRRVKADHEMMKDAVRDAGGTKGQGGGDDKK